MTKTIKSYVCLDVGGTYTKGMVFNLAHQPLLPEILYFPSHSTDSAETVVANLVDIIVTLTQQVKTPLLVEKCSLAFPGPFDYGRGIPYLRGLGKFDSLYGKELGRLLEVSLEHALPAQGQNIIVHFANDAVAFATGEYWSSNPLPEKAAYITLGTGCGSSFVQSGKLVKDEQGIPASGMIYDEPFKNGLIDDYLSARGLAKIIRKIYGNDVPLMDIVNGLTTNDHNARLVFDEFGSWLGEALKPFIASFSPDVLVLGGQISKSFSAFEPNLKAGLGTAAQGLPIHISQDTSMATLRGLNDL